MNYLGDIISVPYLPVLGPVHPREVSQKLLAEIEASSRSGVLLPYDKSRRWYKEPTERITTIHKAQDSKNMTIATTTKRGERHYFYGNVAPADATGTIITFSREPLAPDPDEGCSVIFLDEYEHKMTQYPDEHIRYAHELHSDQIAQLLMLSDPASRGGFEMLIRDNLISSHEAPTLIYVDNGEVLGALGPLNILKDSRGIERILPCYFAVKSSARRQGVGAALWQAMRSWAYDHRARYKLLQAEYGSPAEHFYRRQDLRCLGYVYKKQNS